MSYGKGYSLQHYPYANRLLKNVIHALHRLMPVHKFPDRKLDVLDIFHCNYE